MPPSPLPRASSADETHWPQLTSTLISGDRDAVLVDALITQRGTAAGSVGAGHRKGRPSALGSLTHVGCGSSGANTL